MKIEGKVFVVTGGASGLGAATATHLVAQGASVIMVDMNHELGEEMQKRLGEKSKFVPLDVTNEIAVEQFFKQLEQDYGQLNGLINCAGIGPSAKKVLNINVSGTFNMLRFAADVISRYELAAGEEDRGVIINTASVAAFDGQIGQTAYAASKVLLSQ
ncbi:hypothetical protein FQR65_LT16936 [Abscondita terminalis]|nr:hypothetical protein FQR65_LT16936 [Abscondita terminalis]